MNEHHGASADGLLLLWRLASPSHSISALLSAMCAICFEQCPTKPILHGQ